MQFHVLRDANAVAEKAAEIIAAEADSAVSASRYCRAAGGVILQQINKHSVCLVGSGLEVG
jgi:hypothetical protein